MKSKQRRGIINTYQSFYELCFFFQIGLRWQFFSNSVIKHTINIDVEDEINQVIHA